MNMGNRSDFLRYPPHRSELVVRRISYFTLVYRLEACSIRAPGLARLGWREFLGSPPASLNTKTTLEPHRIVVTKSTQVTMAEEERRSSKRSRFDQTEPEPKRSSRFDRRSRSPSSRQPDTRRSRSPLASNKTFSPAAEGIKSPSDPAAAAGRSLSRLPPPLLLLTLPPSRGSSSY